jgi:hypothetical protein
VGPESGLDAVEKKKYIAFAGNRTPEIQPLVHRYID